MEEALYRNAGSQVRPRHAAEPARYRYASCADHPPWFLQEEYSDITTLEQRLQQVARTFVSSKNNRQQQAQQQQQRPASADLPGLQGGSVPRASTAAPSMMLQQQQGQQLSPGRVLGGLSRDAMLYGLREPGSLMPGAGMPYRRPRLHSWQMGCWGWGAGQCQELGLRLSLYCLPLPWASQG